MKNLKKFIASIIAMLMIFATAGFAVYALDEVNVNATATEEKVQEQLEESEPELIDTITKATDIVIDAVYYKDNNKCSIAFKWTGSGDYTVYAQDKNGVKYGKKNVDENYARINNLERGSCYSLIVMPTTSVDEAYRTSFGFLATKLEITSKEDNKLTLNWYGPDKDADLDKYTADVYHCDSEGVAEATAVMEDYVLTDVSAIGTTLEPELKATIYDDTGNWLENDENYAVVLSYEEKAAKISRAALVGFRPDRVSGFKGLPSYNQVKLSWNKVDNATGYEIYRNGSRIATISSANTTIYRDKSASMYSDNSYKIYSLAGQRRSLTPARVTERPVQDIYYNFRLDETCTLKSQDGAQVSKTFYAGTWINSTGYGGGCYYFLANNGRPYRVSYTRTSNCTAYFTQSFNYTKETALDYVNQKNPSKSRGWFIWTNFYTQHLYIFRVSGGNWVLDRDWEICSGAPTSPSPSGDMQLGARKKCYQNPGHGSSITWWSFVTSSGNAFHSWPSLSAGGWEGWPASGGCVRNYVENAKYIYYTVDDYAYVYNK